MLLNCKPLAGVRAGAPAVQWRSICSWRPAALWRPVVVRLKACSTASALEGIPMTLEPGAS